MNSCKLEKAHLLRKKISGKISGKNFFRNYSFLFTLIFPGSRHHFRLMALTGHSVGDSKPSNVISVFCPSCPQAPEVYAKETFTLGCISIGWKPTDTACENDSNHSPCSYGVFVNGQFHSSCPGGSFTDIFMEENVYCVSDCVVGRKYELFVRAHSEPKIIERQDGSKLFICGCYGDASNIVEAYCAGPPSAPDLRVARIDENGVTLKWSRSYEYGSVPLAVGRFVSVIVGTQLVEI